MAAKTDKAGDDISVLFAIYTYTAGQKWELHLTGDYCVLPSAIHKVFGPLEIQSILYTLRYSCKYKVFEVTA